MLFCQPKIGPASRMRNPIGLYKTYTNKYGEEEEEGEEEAKKEIGHSRARPNSVSPTHDSSCPQDDHQNPMNVTGKD